MGAGSTDQEVRRGRPGEVTGHGPAGLGWTIDWLPDGRLLVTGKELLRREPDGSIVRHADLSGAGKHGWNDMVVDGRGNIYVTSIRFEFLKGSPPQSGIIALVTPDGKARQVLDSEGLGKQFVHSTGHGLGLEIHEPPRVGKKDPTRLEAGMVITIEPGAYVRDFGGVRIEDTVLVTKNGCEVLTPTSKELVLL